MNDTLALPKKQILVQPPKMYIVEMSVSRTVPFTSLDIGRVLKSSLSNIFNLSENEIHKILLNCIRTGYSAHFGEYTREIAETKANQANKVFSSRVSIVLLSFYIK